MSECEEACEVCRVSGVSRLELLCGSTEELGKNPGKKRRKHRKPSSFGHGCACVTLEFGTPVQGRGDVKLVTIESTLQLTMEVEHTPVCGGQ